MDELLRWLRKRNLLTTFIEILQKVGLLKITFRIYQKLQARLSGSNQQYPTRQAQAPELPIPSSDLIVLVAGTPDVNWFLSFGHLCLRSYEAPCMPKILNWRIYTQ